MRILVAEDEMEQMEVIKYCLLSIIPDAQIIEAGNGLELLEQLDALNTYFSLPDLIILDLNMPRLDGRITLQKLRTNPAYSHLSIALFTSSVVQMDRMYGKLDKTPLFLKNQNIPLCRKGILSLLEYFKLNPVSQTC